MSKALAWNYKFKFYEIIEILKSTKIRQGIKEVSDEREKSCKIKKFNAVIPNRMKIVNYVNQENNKLSRLLNKYRRYQIHIDVNIDEAEVINIERDDDNELLKMI